MADVREEVIEEWRPRASYLEDNAFSHSWAFSAMAELIDNAHDAYATKCRIQVLNRTKHDEAMLLISDNGHGMSFKELKIMLNLGHCNSGGETRSHKPLGRYGTGFKSGSIHLARDALVFTRMKRKQRVLNVGMLSQTLNGNGPSVHYPLMTGDFATLMSSNSEACKAIRSVFDSADIEAVQRLMLATTTRTAILLKRLKYKFKFGDGNDIKTSSQTTGFGYKQSLRDYCRILYREPRMSITIGNEEVTPLNIEAALDHLERIPYKPKEIDGVETKLTIGLNNKEELKNEYGIMLYWRNRLIRPFERTSLGFQSFRDRQVRLRCIGIVDLDGILTPVPNKQDFEKTSRHYSRAIRRFRDKLSDYAKKYAQKTRNDDAAKHRRPSYEFSVSSSDEDEEESVKSGNDGEDELERETYSPEGHTGITSGTPEKRPGSGHDSLTLSPKHPRLEDTGDGTGHWIQNPATGDGTGHGIQNPATGDGTGHGIQNPATGDGTGHGIQNPAIGDGTGHGIQNPATGDGTGHAIQNPATGDGTGHAIQKPKTALEKKFLLFQSNVFKLLSHIMLFFDPGQEPLETPFFELGKEADIVQTVINLVKEFGLVYVKPRAYITYKIPPPPKLQIKKHMESWTSVTQIFIDTEGPIRSLKEIAAVRGRETFNEVNIRPSTMKQYLHQLCDWLSKSENNVLVGHSMDTRDRPALMSALDSCDLMDTFQREGHVIGFLDTTELFKMTHPGLERHKLKDLVAYFLGINSFSHHNALGDAKVLQALINKWDGIYQDQENQQYKKKASRSMESSEEVFQKSKRIRENSQDLQPMVASKVISYDTAKKIADSGLNLGHLRRVFDKGGWQGMRDVLSEPTHCGARVTNKETMVTQIVSYFRLNP